MSVLAQKEEQFIKDVMTVVCEFCFDPDLKDIGKYTLSDSNFSRVSPILMKYLQVRRGKQHLDNVIRHLYNVILY